jgi:hypothetical protein
MRAKKKKSAADKKIDSEWRALRTLLALGLNAARRPIVAATSLQITNTAVFLFVGLREPVETAASNDEHDAAVGIRGGREMRERREQRQRGASGKHRASSRHRHLL